jgi:hypothetical protein
MKELLGLAASPIIKDGTVKIGVDADSVVTLAVAIVMVAVIIILLTVLLRK